MSKSKTSNDSKTKSKSGGSNGNGQHRRIQQIGIDPRVQKVIVATWQEKEAARRAE